MTLNQRLTRHTSTWRDPFILTGRIVIIVALALIVLLIHAMAQRGQAAANHPCPPWNFAAMTPTGWGCATSQTIGVKAR